MRKFIAHLILLPLIFLISTVVVADNSQRAIEDGHLGMEAYRQGHYELSLWFLNAAISAADNDMPERELWLNTKAHIFWETGKDIQLLDYAQFQLNPGLEEKWWCHVLERRGHAGQAATCWYRLNDQRRGRRAVRTDAMVDVFTPPWTLYGYRPEPYPGDK